MGNKIIVIFGPSGSGKSYIIKRLCENPKFKNIPKTSNREKRKDDFSVEHLGGKIYGFDFTSEDALSGAEVVFDNFGYNYSLDIGSIDRAIVAGQIPVIILRSREQFAKLEELYPDFEIEKFYIRPDKEKLVGKLEADMTRSKFQIQKRIKQIDSEFAYHDETAKNDGSVMVIENNYENDDFLEPIYGAVGEQALKDTEAESFENYIVFGDKIRISNEPKFSYEAKEIDCWYAKVISGGKLKFDLGPFIKFEDLYLEILNRFHPDFQAKTKAGKGIKDYAEFIEKFRFLSKAAGQCYSDFSEIEEENKEFIRQRRFVTNQYNCFDRELLAVPGFVLDTEFDHLGFKLCYKTPNFFPLWQNVDFDRDYDKRRMDLIGYEQFDDFLRSSELTPEVLNKSIKGFVKGLGTDRRINECFLGDTIKNRIFEAGGKLSDSTLVALLGTEKM